jgi:hypothetical protein
MTLPRALLPVFAVLALSASAPPVAAQEEGPRWVAGVKKALAIAKERGHPILVWCVMDNDDSNKKDADNLRNKEVLKAMRGYLVVLGDPEDGHGSRPGTIDGKPAKVCALAPGITCADHKRAVDEVYTMYGTLAVDKSSNMRMPVHFVLDSSGKVLGQINSGSVNTGFDAVPPAAMAKQLLALLVKAGGPGLSDEQYDRFQKLLVSARTSVEGNRMSEAAKALKPLVDLGKELELMTTARELLKRVDKEASTALAKAQSNLASDPVNATAAMDKVVEDYPGTDSAVSAKKMVGEFRESAEGKQAVKDLARDKEGRAKLEKAMEVANGGKDDARALRLLDGLAKEYAGLPTGRDAAKQAQAIRDDPERKKSMEKADAEKAARSALTAAKGLLDSGKKDEARKALQDVLDKHAGTAAAEEAKKLLEGIR